VALIMWVARGRDLADIRKEGKLNKDEFAVAMYLINKKLGGVDPPAVLPMSLIPPSLREQGKGQGQSQGQSQTQRDLFDLFADSPPASAQQTGNYFPAALSVNTTGQQQGQQQQQQKQLPGGTESFGTTTFGEFFSFCWWRVDSD
jgi:epidermal growth factor receptor substrate 15